MTQSDIINNNFSKAFECIKCSNAYDTGAVLSEEKLFKQISERKHSTFDLSKFTVVGSPTITDDGVASGFSSTNYVDGVAVTLDSQKNIEIDFEYTTGATVSTDEVILSIFNDTTRAFYLLRGTSNEMAASFEGSGGGYVISRAFFQNNTSYNFKLVTNLYDSWKLYNNNTLVLQGNNITASNRTANKVYIGSSGGSMRVVNGSIDLKQFSITVDGKEVFSGNKTGIDTIKSDNFITSGTGSVTQEGIASGAYVLSLNNIDFSTSPTKWTIISPKFKITEASTSVLIPFAWGNANTGAINFSFRQNGALGMNYNYNNGSGIAIVSVQNVVKTNTYYQFKWEYNNTILNMYYREENYEWILLGTDTVTACTSNGQIEFSRINSNGCICDLNSCKVYMNDKLLFQPCLKIPYTQSKTGSKIVDVTYRDRVIDLYEQEGKAKYYTIDEPNKNFTLPMGEIYGMIENIKNTKSGGSGLEIGDISMALYVDETKGLRRYLNGQIVDINANTQAFLNRLLEIKSTNPDYFTTEENWQSEALLNIDGCVYKFVLNYAGDTVVSVRLPKYPDYVEINAGGTLPVVGNGLCLGITNGSGTAGFYHYQSNTAYVNVDNERYGTPVGGSVSNNSGTLYGGLGITTDPTKSGIQTTLKQTKLKLRYFIQIATGSETENNIINDIELNNPFSLFDSKYSAHELNNISWLKSEGQWNAKAVYPTAYDKLLKVYNGTETVNGLSVKLSTEDYTDYDFVLNTADETFRLPLSNNQRFVIETHTDGEKGYRIWSDGYCHQWGQVNGSGVTVTLLKPMSNTYYHINLGGGNSTGWGNNAHSFTYYNVTVNSFQIKMEEGSTLSPSMNCNWDVFGYLAEGGYTPQKLYYYVGETVQNANLIDAGRIGEVLATKTDMLQASGAGMPSNRYIDLTLGASGSTYTAPANGYIHLTCHAQGGIGWFNLYAVYGVSTNIPYATSGGGLAGFIPIIKGQKFGVHYGSIGVDSFRFVYAEGSK